jgi:hypothetical protein
MNAEQHEQLYLALRKLISPPNPIIDKQIAEEVSIIPLKEKVEEDSSDEEEDSR